MAVDGWRRGEEPVAGGKAAGHECFLAFFEFEMISTKYSHLANFYE